MKDLDLIDDFILGNLSQEDKNRFETSLASDSKLQTLVNERKELILVTQLASATARKKELKQLLGKGKFEETTAVVTPQLTKENKATTAAPDKKNSGKLVRLLPYLTAAACIGAFLFVMLFKTSAGLDPLVNEYYSPYSVTVRSTTGTTTKEKAFQLYNNKEYKAAIPLLGQLSANNQEAQLLLGIAQFETGASKEALTQFKALLAEDSELFNDHAKWYAALTYLQLDQSAEAKPLLQSLTNQTEYAAKARELLAKLNSK